MTLVDSALIPQGRQAWRALIHDLQRPECCREAAQLVQKHKDGLEGLIDATRSLGR